MVDGVYVCWSVAFHVGRGFELGDSLPKAGYATGKNEGRSISPTGNPALASLSNAEGTRFAKDVRLGSYQG